MSTTDQLLTELKTNLKYIKEGITDCKDRLSDMNGSIRDINEWRIRHEEQLKIWKGIVTTIGVPIVLYLAYKFINYIL